MEHLDLVELDAVRAGEATAGQSGHAESCPECRSILADIRGLAEDVKKLDRPSVSIPPDIDRRILARRRPRLWIPIAAAAAAAVLLTVGLLLVPGDRQTRMMAGAREDIDQSGGVDILDAWSLASRIRSGARLDPKWDMNGDGVVNEDDVDVIARECVSLSSRTPQ